MVRYTLGKVHHVIILQSKQGNKYYYEINVDGRSEVRIINTNPKSYPSVRLYRSDPWYDHFSSEFGSVCNVNIQQLNSGKQLFIISKF